jgi:hypothetical protein
MTQQTSLTAESAVRCPFSDAEKRTLPAFSVVDALSGFAGLLRRPENLNGSIPARAAACKPFLDGNRAGVHVRLSQPVMLSRDLDRPALQMTDELYEIVYRNYSRRLSQLIARGFLIQEGYWHRRLGDGPVSRDDQTISLWTGLLLKPASGLWLLVDGAYNRRSEVNLREYVIADSAGYTPLILEFDLSSMMKDTMWLETALACVMPLQPGARFSRSDIRRRPELGAAHNEFYSQRYLESRGENKGTGQYRKLLAGASTLQATLPAAKAACELVHIAGPDVHTIETFDRVLGPDGPMPPEVAGRLEFAVLRNSTPLEFDFDGIQAHLNNDGADSHGEELLAVWRDLYGEQSLHAVDWWTPYFLPNAPSLLGEPHVLLIPYAFTTTPPGWSVLADGFHYPGLDGLRAVVATDLFHFVGHDFQFRRPGDFRLEVGDPLIRLLPIPRYLLDAPYEPVELEN